MDAVFSGAELRDGQVEVKKAVHESLGRIAENDGRASASCPDEVSRRRADDAVDGAPYCASVEEAIARGRVAYMSGDYVEGIDAAFAEAIPRRLSRG